jgi:hypothetical protein
MLSVKEVVVILLVNIKHYFINIQFFLFLFGS